VGSSTGLVVGLVGLGFTGAGLVTTGFSGAGRVTGLTRSGLKPGTFASGTGRANPGAVGYFLTKLADPSNLFSGLE